MMLKLNKILLFFVLQCVVMICAGQTKEGFTISEISDQVMARMQGKSFPKDCTVDKNDLRYLTVKHYDEKGDVKQGEIVCNKQIANDLIEIFWQLYEIKYPIEKMVLIDEYDGDDERSMTDNNTSCFNYRTIAGSKKLSKHAQGLAIDINPRYNPCVRAVNGKLVSSPQSGRNWAFSRSTKKHPMLIKYGDQLHQLFLKHGFRWGGSWKTLKDYQHFEK